MNNSKGPIIGLGIVGLLIGGFIAFLARPSAFLVGQLPFQHVISRGLSLKGMDQMLLPIAQRSFNITLIGVIIGAIAGIIIGYFIAKTKTAQIGSNFNKNSSRLMKNTFIFRSMAVIGSLMSLIGIILCFEPDINIVNIGTFLIILGAGIGFFGLERWYC